MIEQIQIQDLLLQVNKMPVIDVRSPAEFLKGHIPGALNIPLFNNEERAIIGTKYSKESRNAAVKTGLDIIGPKLSSMIDQYRSIVNNNQVIIHCWRGGLRSESIAWLLNTAGIKSFVLSGGYKAYRRYQKEYYSKKANLIILGGKTGSGKTAILHEIENLGEQVVDLESIAHHKGSVFGALGQKPQPTNEQFENDIFKKWINLNVYQNIWLEDESRVIGKNIIPDEIWSQMNNSPLITLEMGKKLRIKRLEKEYTRCNMEELINSILKISKRIGGLNTRKSIQAVEKKDYFTAIDLSLTYYDKAYQYSISKRKKEMVFTIILEEDDPGKNAIRVLDFAKKNGLLRNLHYTKPK
jgi:tRNA 2-selenouridine synthase